MKICHKCRKTLEIDSISFRDECPFCRSDLHVCMNCIFYDVTKANSCRETQADYVREKERANYCDYFRFIDRTERISGREEAEKLWNKLFQKN